MNLICNSPTCNGKVIPYVSIDGLSTGSGRLLDGIMFRAYFDNRKEIKIEIDPIAYSYFETLNKSRWYKEIENLFRNMISDKDFYWAECPECMDGIYIEVK